LIRISWVCCPRALSHRLRSENVGHDYAQKRIESGQDAVCNLQLACSDAGSLIPHVPTKSTSTSDVIETKRSAADHFKWVLDMYALQLQLVT